MKSIDEMIAALQRAKRDIKERGKEWQVHFQLDNDEIVSLEEIADVYVSEEVETFTIDKNGRLCKVPVSG